MSDNIKDNPPTADAGLRPDGRQLGARHARKARVCHHQGAARRAPLEHLFQARLPGAGRCSALWTYLRFQLRRLRRRTLGRHTALIEIDGEIEAEGSGAADNVIPSLNKAFADAGSAAVVLRINSPGGSPVQAGIIVDEILRLKRGYPNKPLYVVVDEICASGGYYIAAAADKIYVNKASIVGSVGVLMDGFGFTGTMEKLGVERRLLTAGENKGFLDPFSPQSDKQKAHAQEMLNEIHQQFIAVVRAGRGKRLKETPEMFSGLYWTGAKGRRDGPGRRLRHGRQRGARHRQGRGHRRLHGARRLAGAGAEEVRRFGGRAAR
jgi:signal peptide peptidase SppA